MVDLLKALPKISSWTTFRNPYAEGLRFMTCNSSLVDEFDVRMRPRDTRIEAKIDTRARIGVQIALIAPV
jgi:hypothetical protein